MHRPSEPAINASSCGFDYASEEGRARIQQALSDVAELREQLKVPALAARAGQVERLYERTFGLAVVPTLIGRLVRGNTRHRAVDIIGDSDGLKDEVYEELFGASTSHRTRVYERTLGVAVVPMLVRRAIRRRRAARGTARPS